MAVTLSWRHSALVVLALTLPTQARAQLNEGFDDIAMLTQWLFINNSAPGGERWFQGDPSDSFDANTGAPNSYSAANFRSTTGAGTISNWLLAPAVPLRNGARFSFFTRTFAADELFPDRLERRLSAAGGSVDVGNTPFSVGDFSTLLLSINPALANDYPDAWTRGSVVLTSLEHPASGRFGFRYFVTNAGEGGDNSDYIRYR